MYSRSMRNHRYTNARQKDVSISRRMEDVLDDLYRRMGWKSTRTDSELDLRGVDTILDIPGKGSLMADEKVAARYWDRDLPTYCCELTCDTNRSGLGWFSPEQNGFYATSHYVFVWVRAKDPNLENLTKLEMAIVDKKSLQIFLCDTIGDDLLFRNTRAFCSKVLRFGNRAELAPGITIKKNERGPEFSTNILFDRGLLKEKAIFNKQFLLAS